MGTYQKIYDKGYIDVNSHSKTHAILTDATSPAQHEAELAGARNALRTMLPGQEILTFAPSNNKMDSTSAEMCRDTFWAVRQGKQGYSSINPPENGIGGWYDLKIQGARQPLDRNNVFCGLNDILDKALTEPSWLIEMYHSIDAGGDGTLPVTDSAAASHFKKWAAAERRKDLVCVL